MNNKRSWTIDDLGEAVKVSDSFAEVLRLLGLRTAGGNFGNVKKHIKLNNISTEHFTRKRVLEALKPFKAIHLSEILIENSTYKNNQRLKIKLIEAGILEDVCCKCGQGPVWNNAPLVLQLDHKNGTHNDNRIENLRILCPNCHTQTDSFCGKNVNVKSKPEKDIFKKCPMCKNKLIHKSSNVCSPCRNILNRKVIKRPTRSELAELISNNTWAAVGRMFGVADNTIRKWAKRYNLL